MCLSINPFKFYLNHPISFCIYRLKHSTRLQWISWSCQGFKKTIYFAILYRNATLNWTMLNKDFLNFSVLTTISIWLVCLVFGKWGGGYIFLLLGEIILWNHHSPWRFHVREFCAWITFTHEFTSPRTFNRVMNELAL